MSSEYSPSALRWESVRFKLSKHRIPISISVSLVFVTAIALLLFTGVHEEQNHSKIEDKVIPESLQERRGANSSTLDKPTDPHESLGLAGNIQKGIYFATYGGTVNFFSSTTRNVTTVHSGDEDFRGVTYDPVQVKLYWSSNTKIYRGNMDGSEDTVVLNTTLYGEIKALAFDWITGTIYGVCFRHGYIFACNTKASPLACATVLSNQGQPNGLALNPTEGRMYWTMETNGSVGHIRRAEMDGSNITTIKTGLRFPYAITIDYPNSRLYWTDFASPNIGTSDLDGSNFRSLTIRSGDGWAGNWGIGLLNDRIYWGTWNDMKLKSCKTNGKDFRIEYNGEKRNVHLVSTGMELPRNRKNHCASRDCPTVCVLTATSSRCLN